MDATITPADKFGSFTLGPGDQVHIDAWDNGATFPLEVEVDGARKFTLYDARPLRFPFTQLKVTGARPDSLWLTFVAQGGENIGQALSSPKNIRLFDVEIPQNVSPGVYELPSVEVGAPLTWWNVSRGSGFLFVAHTGENQGAVDGYVKYFAELKMAPDDNYPSHVIPMGDANSHADMAQPRHGHIQLGAGAQELVVGNKHQESRRWPGYVRFYMVNDGGQHLYLNVPGRVQAWILL